jgi:hypothetical protein
MIPENLQKLREQISLDCFKADPNCLYDATELNLLIVEMTREHSVTKAMLERAEKLIARVRRMGLEALYRAIESINKDTHKDKDHSLKQVLLDLRFLIEITHENLEKNCDLDEIPW